MTLAQPSALAQALFDDSSDALVLVDKSDLRLVDANQVAVRLSGRSLEFLKNLRIADLVAHPQPAEMSALEKAVQGNRRFHAPDGFEFIAAQAVETIPVELTLRPLGDEPCALLEIRDVRYRRRLEEQAALAETELSLVLNTVPAAVWCAERSPDALTPKPGEGLHGWRYRYLSSATERVTGWPMEFFRDGPHKFAEIVHPDDRANVLTERTTFLLSPQTSFSMELRVIGQDSIERWIRSDMIATRDAQGRAVRLDGVVTDIGRSKLAEISLRESQRWLTRLLDTNSDGILVLDLAGRISFVNPAAQALIGKSSADLLDLDWNELHWLGAPAGSDDNLKDIPYRTLRSSELLLARPDGSTITVSLSAAPLRNDSGQVTGVVVTLFDLTQRIQAEEAVRRSEERYRRLFERNLAGVSRHTFEGRLLDANPAFAHIFGFSSPLEMSDVSARDHYFSEEEWKATQRRLLEQGQLSNIETRRRRRDGSEVWVLEKLALVEENLGPTIEATLVDITERKRAEQTLADEHSLLLALLNSIPDFIFFKDREGRYRGCNNAFVAYTGRDESEILHRKVSDLFPADFAAELEEQDRQVYATRKPLRVDRVVETKNGSRFVELVLNPMIDSGGNIIGLLGVGRDITERHRLEDQLRQAGKMEAIGRLAGGMAHDFNNLLTMILGNLSLAKNALDGHQSAVEPLHDCERAAERAAELTNQLLGFARRNPLSVQALDLNRNIAETLQMLRRTIDPRVAIESRYADDLWTVEADAGQMSQVLINLCLNARDAVSAGGRILIETSNAHLTQAQTSGNLDARVGDFVCLSITDDGPGITDDVRQRIFEPFFTTKPFGKGTGLGLAVVFGIVRQHHGWIECHCAEGSGTRFEIYLPRSDKPRVDPIAPAEDLPTSGTETILVVDDEPMIRELGRAILSKKGYRVLLAEDGVAGVETYIAHGDAIDLVVLDLSMPNMSGKEALRLLRRANPRARILIASGFSPDDFEDGELAGVVGYISKPYKADDLVKAVRAALDQALKVDDAVSR